MLFGYVIENIAIYCPAELQRNQLQGAKRFDDTNILKLDVVTWRDYPNQTSYTSQMWYLRQESATITDPVDWSTPCMQLHHEQVKKDGSWEQQEASAVLIPFILFTYKPSFICTVCDTFPETQ